MRLTFQLRFYTHPGQSLFLTGDHEVLGHDDVASAIPLEYLNERFWRITLDVPRGALPAAEITYHYILRLEDSSVVEDWDGRRKFNPAAFTKDEVLIIDSWNHPGFYENAFYTEPFQEVLLKPEHNEVQLPMPSVATHLFKVKAPLLKKDQTLCLLGGTAGLWNWDTTRPVLLNRTRANPWHTAELDLSKESFPIAYKYGVYDLARKEFIQYEGGSNRTLDDTVGATKQTIVNDGFAVLPSNTWKGAGVAIPVFSLRSKTSFGVGEFTDLKLLVDWCHKAGIKLIQILPVNDTSATHTAADSYPYAAISAFALHPLYLNLGLVATRANRALLTRVDAERQRLNSVESVDYEAVMVRKLALVKEFYRLQEGQTFKSREYKQFFESNRAWLVPYAVFCYLRDRHGTADFNQWPDHRKYNETEIAALATEGAALHDELALHFFVQFHLHNQLHEATEYAHSKGIILKGDIPIGVYRYGADAWQEPELYRMEMQAGAPPDAFGIKGQNWSFPTYDWARMKETGFAWWKRRFGQMGHYFDAFRIDHILGFFRIWSIPLHAVEGIMGYFVPAIPVQISEFAARGIRFDPERYLKPFITDQVLDEIFGPTSEMVKARFLKRSAPGRYALSAEFATQRQVERFFVALEPSKENQKLQGGLFDLISNVILFAAEEAANQQFHFRFSIETTTSFKNLDGHTQQQLRELYIDYFFRRQEGFWRKEALQKLPALKRVTNMLVCGEDLGMVPACVPEVMRELGLLSLEVQRMPKVLNQEFSHPKDAPYLSVVTPSTHDMSTVRGWWKEDKQVVQRFYNHTLGIVGVAPEECEPWINRAVIVQHLASPAMWSIFQLQDLLGMDGQLRRPNPEDERINVPANPKNYWRYRMHLSLEDLLEAEDFNGGLRREIQQHGR